MIEQILAGMPVIGLAIVIGAGVIAVITLCAYRLKIPKSLGIAVTVIFLVLGFLALCYLEGVAVVE